MSILTKASITKGTPAVFTLDKAELASLGSVSSNTLFSNQSNWSRVVITFKSTVNKQTKTLIFRGSQVTALFKTSAYADNIFRIQRINIYDKDGANLLISRSQLNEAGFDIDLSVAPPDYIVWDNLYQGAATNSTGKLYKGFAKDIYSSTDTNARSSNQIGPFGGVFEMKFVISRTDSFGVKVGLALSPLSNSNMYLSVGALNGDLTLNNVDGNNANFPSSLGLYDINTDFEIRIKVSAGLIEVYKDGVAVGTPQMWLSGYYPDQMFFAAANVSHLAAPSENVNTEVAILKSSTRISET
jgi:hypothetical protein